MDPKLIEDLLKLAPVGASLVRIWIDRNSGQPVIVILDGEVVAAEGGRDRIAKWLAAHPEQK